MGRPVTVSLGKKVELFSKGFQKFEGNNDALRRV